MEKEAKDKYLITGVTGQLGYELNRLLGAEEQALPRTHDSLDVSSTTQVTQWMQMVHPAAVINCAAYTNVQKASANFRECWATNVDGPRNLAIAASKKHIPLIHISTDYVFGMNPRRRTPYREQSPVGPMGVYGTSKVLGEQAILYWMTQRPAWPAFIIRTAGLFERPWRYKPNFPQQIYSALHCRSQQEVFAVDDAWTNLTYAPHLAKVIAWMLKSWRGIKPGIYHVTNQGECSWYDAASALAARTRHASKLRRVNRKEYARIRGRNLASSPVYTCLDQSLYQHLKGGPPMPSWQDAIKEWVRAKRKQTKETSWDTMEEEIHGR